MGNYNFLSRCKVIYPKVKDENGVEKTIKVVHRMIYLEGTPRFGFQHCVYRAVLRGSKYTVSYLTVADEVKEKWKTLKLDCTKFNSGKWLEEDFTDEYFKGKWKRTDDKAMTNKEFIIWLKEKVGEEKLHAALDSLWGG